MKFVIVDPVPIVPVDSPSLRDFAQFILAGEPDAELLVLASNSVEKSPLGSELLQCKDLRWIHSDATSVPGLVRHAVDVAEEIDATGIVTLGYQVLAELDNHKPWNHRSIVVLTRDDADHLETLVHDSKTLDRIDRSVLLSVAQKYHAGIANLGRDLECRITDLDGSPCTDDLKAWKNLAPESRPSWPVMAAISLSDGITVFRSDPAVCNSVKSTEGSTAFTTGPESQSLIQVCPITNNVTLFLSRSATGNNPEVAKRECWWIATFMEKWHTRLFVTSDIGIVAYSVTHPDLAPHIALYLRASDIASGLADSSPPQLKQVLRSHAPIVVPDQTTANDLEILEPQTAQRTGALNYVDMFGRRGLPRQAARFGVQRRIQGSGNKRVLRLVVAGHDLKFARHLIRMAFRHKSIELVVDKWPSQHRKGNQRQEQLAAWADVVWVEFASSAASWYSRQLPEPARLVIRVHGYEVDGAWADQLDWKRVSQLVSVSQHLAKRAAERWDLRHVPIAVIPNSVDVQDLDREKKPAARHTIGMLGWQPSLKRIDRALDILSHLRRADQRYTLSVMGSFPTYDAWHMKHTDEQLYYAAVLERLRTDKSLLGAVQFENASTNIAQWLQNIGWVASTSDRESFHLAAIEGMASGAIPLVLARVGVEAIFPQRYIHDSIHNAVRYVQSLESPADFACAANEAKLAAVNYDFPVVEDSLIRVITGS